MIDDLAHMANLSTFSVVTIILMCLICGFIVGQLLNSIPATIFVYAGFGGVAYLANVLWRRYQVTILPNKDQDAILATTFGLIGGLILFVIFKLVMTAMYGHVRAVPKTDLEAVESRSNF